MKVLFFASEKDREQALAKNFLAGAKLHRWDVEQRELVASPEIEPGTTAVCMVGVKSKRLFKLAQKAGAVPVMFDKGYVRRRSADSRVWDFWRVSVGAHHPTHTTLMLNKMPGDRRDKLGLNVRAWRSRGYSVVIAGSSAKYHDFYGLPDPETYYGELVEKLRGLTDRPVIYRPKPSYRDAVPIPGAEFSEGKENVMAALEGAWCMVTHGSNASFEAALLGVPSIVLGDGVAAPISSTRLEEVVSPVLGKREQWLANLAYHQWTEREMREGAAFEHIGGWISERAKQRTR